MGEPINLSLPSVVDDFDQAIDTGWEYIRSSESINKLIYFFLYLSNLCL